jgi:uncharacterized membrane protein
MDETIPLPLACPDCAAKMPESAVFCPGCGRSMQVVAARAQGKVGFLLENIAGALAYLTFIPAAVFLFLEPYKKNRFVRFHSIQSLLLWVAAILIAIALKLGGLLVFMIPVVGPLVLVLISVFLGLAAFVVWLVLVVKALQGERFKLPALGDFAEQNAGSHQTPHLP